jgi:hypothetical protein
VAAVSGHVLKEEAGEPGNGIHRASTVWGVGRVLDERDGTGRGGS